MPLLGSRGAASAKGFGFTGATGAAPGQQAYTTPGTYTWVAPAGVTSVSVVTVGPGSSGTSDWGYSGNGGSLRYKNNIAVTPGSSYTVVVGAACENRSYFNTTATVSANGGVLGGGGTGTGGNGGAGGQGLVCCGGGYHGGGGGGGAGGYSGNGGDGGKASFLNGWFCWSYMAPGFDGTGGAGGGGAGGWTGHGCGGYGGGGVGILGAGASGTGGTVPASSANRYCTVLVGKGGSGGANGTVNVENGGNGGAYGGGSARGNGSGVGAAAGGAVRIIWPGTTRLFPSTGTGNV